MRRTILIAVCIGAVAARSSAQQEGSLQWPFTVNGYISLSSPALSPDGSTIYIGVTTDSGGRVIAASQQGGSRWGRNGRILPAAAAVEASPVVSGGAIYVGAKNGRLYVLDPATGSDLREPVFLGGEITSSPAVGPDGTLYVATSTAVSPTEFVGHLHAVTPAGTRLWSFQTAGAIESSPAVAADGTIYLGCHDRNLYAFTPTGEKKWEYSTNGPIFSSPALAADGTIYVGSRDQNLHAVTPDGQRKWEKATNDWIDASPALGADGTIYFASFDRNFYAVRPDGTEKWRTNINSASVSSAAVRADGAIIVGADDGIVRAFNPLNGAVMWTFDTRARPGDYIESSPTIGPDGSIYIGSLDGTLYKINGNGSPLSSVSSWPSFRRDVRRTGRAVATNTGAQLVNIATRAQAGGGNNLVAGFVVQGTPGSQQVFLVRAVGPALAKLGVSDFLPDPRLNVHSGQLLLQTSGDWKEPDEESFFSVVETSVGVGAFVLDPGSKDAAIVRPLPPGAFTAGVTDDSGGVGVGLVEIYDSRVSREGNARIVNLSTRGQVGTGGNILIAGVAVGGTGSMRLLLRGIGPGLSQFGVAGVLARPRLELFRVGEPQSLGVNTGWSANGQKGDIAGAAATVAAFELVEGSADSAMLFEAQPGLYTVQISGVGGTVGEAMVEVYVLP